MRYRFICCSDTHGIAPALPDFSGVTAVLHGGDFYDGRLLRRAMAKDSTLEDSREFYSTMDFHWIDSALVPIYAVRGNHDVADPLGVFSRVTDVTETVIPIAPNLFLAGIGWHGEVFFELPTEADMFRICLRLHRTTMRVMGPRDRLILLTHYPGRFSEIMPPNEFASPSWAEPIRQLVREINPL